MASSSPSKGTTGPALAAELGKAEARQAKNLWVTTKAIDGLADRIARAKRDLESRRSGASVGSAKGSGAGTAAGGSERAGRKPSAQAAVAAAAAAAASDSSATTPTKLKPTASKPSPSASPSSRSPCMSSPSKPASKGSAKPPTSRAAVAAAAAAAITSVASEGGASDGGATGRQKADAMELERGVEASGAGSGSGAGMGMGASGGVLAGLARDVEGMKPLETVGSEHKNFHATISKLAKAAEKQFGADVESVRRTPRLNEKALDTAIITHLYRRGAFRSAARFAKDSAAVIPAETSAQLVEMHGVLDALNKLNLAPAERWLEKRRTALEGVGSTLEFQLARLRFLNFLKSADPQQRREAVLFSRQRLAPLSEGHMRQVQELMGSILWAGRLEESPYGHLLSADLWGEVKESVVVDGSRVSGLSRESILAVAFRAGVLALPTLIKMAAVVRDSNQEWNGMQELPLEVPLPPGLRYHSMFSCPVSREPSTPGNPPVLLKCGHAVLRSSVSRLARNGPKFKCPTCPVEQTENETMALTL